MLVIVKRKGNNRQEMTEVFALMEGSAQVSGLVLLDAQTGSAKVMAKYIKDGQRLP